MWLTPLSRLRRQSLGLKRGLFDAELLQQDNGEKVFAEKGFQQAGIVEDAKEKLIVKEKTGRKQVQ